MSTNFYTVDLNDDNCDVAEILSHIELKDPTIITYKNGESNTVANWSYDNDGDECNLYVTYPSQNGWGPSEQYPYKTPDNMKTPENVKGYQMTYSATSLETMNAPTEKEQRVIDFNEGLQKKVHAAIKRWKKNGTFDDLDDGPKNLLQVPGQGLKAVFAHPNKDHPTKPNKKVPDTSKPQREYFSLLTSGKQGNIDILCKFYEPSKKTEGAFVRKNPLKYMGQRGIVTPTVHVQDVYIGDKAPNPLKIRQKFVDVTFEPIVGNSFVPENVTGRNVVEEDDDDETQSHSQPSSQSKDKVVAKQYDLSDDEEDGEVFKTAANPLSQLDDIVKENSKGDDDDSEEEEKPKTKKTTKKTTVRKRKGKKVVVSDDED
jgi:hypothetical protein